MPRASRPVGACWGGDEGVMAAAKEEEEEERGKGAYHVATCAGGKGADGLKGKEAEAAEEEEDMEALLRASGLSGPVVAAHAVGAVGMEEDAAAEVEVEEEEEEEEIVVEEDMCVQPRSRGFAEGELSDLSGNAMHRVGVEAGRGRGDCEAEGGAESHAAGPYAQTEVCLGLFCHMRRSLLPYA